MQITIPTWLTLLRLFLILPILLLLLADFPLWALVLTIVALLTDWLDGYIARRTKTITDVGTFLDHFADKMLAHIILLYFVAVHGLSAIAYGVFLVRDFLILGVRHMAVQKGKEIGSLSLGKIKFLGQSVLLILLMVGLVWTMPLILQVTDWVLWITVALTAISAIQLFVKGWPVITQ